jgi:hypothetical protein
MRTGPAVVSGPSDIGEYLISDGSPVNGTKGGYAERYIHSEVLFPLSLLFSLTDFKHYISGDRGVPIPLVRKDADEP